MNNYKELTMVFHYDKFLNWRKQLPFLEEIPDNELSYIIFDGLLKPYNRDTDVLGALRNAIQYTTLADSVWYKTKRERVLFWLIEGTELFKNDIIRHLSDFSVIKNIFTETHKRHNYIMLNVCGDRRINGIKETNRNIPSNDGIPELIYSSNFNALLHQRRNS